MMCELRRVFIVNDVQNPTWWRTQYIHVDRKFRFVALACRLMDSPAALLLLESKFS